MLCLVSGMQPVGKAGSLVLRGMNGRKVCFTSFEVQLQAGKDFWLCELTGSAVMYWLEAKTQV